MWFIGVEVEQETSAPPPKKNPGSAPVTEPFSCLVVLFSTNYMLFRPQTVPSHLYRSFTYLIFLSGF